MRKIVLAGMAVLSALALAGCGLGKDNTVPPTPLVNFQSTLAMQTLWSVNLGNGNAGYYFRLTPAADNNMVFAANYAGVVSAVNAQTGRVIWSRKLGEHVTSGMAAGNGAVYMGTQEANMIAVSEQDGHLLWKQPVTDEILGAPVYAKNVVVVQTLSGTLTGLSAVDGHHLWRFDQTVPSLVLHASGAPQVSGNTVVAGFANGALAALNIQNGHVMWEQHVAYPTGDNPISQMIDVTVTPVILDGGVYAATYQGKVAGFNLQTGQGLWDHDISSYAGIAGTMGQVFVSDANSYVWAFDTDSGAVSWKQTQLAGRQITGPVVTPRGVFVADHYGYLHALSLQDGHFIGRANIGQGALAQPIIYQGNIYVYTEKGNLVAVRMGK